MLTTAYGSGIVSRVPVCYILWTLEIAKNKNYTAGATHFGPPF